MNKHRNKIYLVADNLLKRSNASRLLSEMRNERNRSIAALDPGIKMKNAFMMSIELRKLRIASLRSQKFTELEINAILGARGR